MSRGFFAIYCGGKFHNVNGQSGDAESFGQVLLRSYFLRRGSTVLRTESPRRSFGTYGRGNRRCSEGAAVAEGFPQAHRMPRLHKLIGTTIPICTETPVRRRKYPARRRELFSLRKKHTAGIRPSAWQKTESLCRLDPTPFRP